MTEEPARPRPLKEAARLTSMLDAVFGPDRFDKAPVDVESLALEYSAQIAAEGRIHEVSAREIEGCVGALVCSENLPRQWAILYHVDQALGRRAFTIAHELGHFILHRRLIETDARFGLGIYCDQESVHVRNGTGLEQEADQFAAALLMPLHDYRRQLSPKTRPTFDGFSQIAARYGVSLTAALLRWLEYTELRAMVIASNEGYALWAKSSAAAFKSGRFIRTRGTVFELPSLSAAVTRDFSTEARHGREQNAGVWFPEPVIEMCLRSDRYDQELTLLLFEREPRCDSVEQHTADTFDRFSS